jgi:hypothetical protein
MSEHELAPEERLRALDPAASAGYEPADLAGMLARITATEHVEKVRIADGLRLRIGAAVTAAALVTVGAIGAIEAAAPSLSVLALGSKQGSTTNATQRPGPDLRVLGGYHFVAGPHLSSEGSSAPIYRISGPADAEADATRISSDLGVPTSPQPIGSPPTSTWTYAGRAGTVQFWNDAGYLSWDYQSASPGAVTSPPASTTASSAAPVFHLADSAPTASEQQDVAAATSLMGGLEVASADIGPASSITYDSGNSTNVEVDFPWRPSGVDTGLNYSFTYDAQGRLLYASGFDGSSSPAESYPLVSPREGVTQLQQQVDQFTYPSAIESPPTATVSGGSGASGGSGTARPGATPNNGETTTTVPQVTVELDSETTMYALFTLSDGTSALLPEYLYSAADGARWSVIAIEPQYVHLAPQVRPMIF